MKHNLNGITPKIHTKSKEANLVEELPAKFREERVEIREDNVESRNPLETQP